LRRDAVPNPDLLQLVTDSADVADLLQALGEEPLADPDRARTRLNELYEEIDQSVLVDRLLRYAGSFAVMAQEVMDLLDRVGVPLAGQIQLDLDGETLGRPALRSSWAYGQPLQSVSDGAGDATLAARIHAVVNRLQPDALITESEEWEDTNVLRGMRRSDRQDHWMIVNTPSMRRSFQRRRRWESASVADLQAIELIAQDLGRASALGNLSHLPASADAVDRLRTRVVEVKMALQEVELDRGGERSPEVAALLDETQLLMAMLTALVEETVEGRRVEEGFRDFVRTEFWFQRWRIYELWLLARLVRCLELRGAVIDLHGVRDGVWVVKYGRADRPIATARFPEGELNLHYQLFQAGDEGADMPDLVIMPPAGRPLVVIDPKHGRSYTRSRVEEVLHRYARHLQADLTAIVNYYWMPGYSFEDLQSGGREWVLASGVAPGTVTTERLELGVTSVLLGRGYGNRPAVAVSSPAPPRARTRAAQLVWWTSHAIEIDEPAGAWTLEDRRGARAVGGLPSPLDRSFYDPTPAANSGSAYLIRDETGYALVRERSGLRHLPELSDNATFLGWHPHGSAFAFMDRGSLKVFEATGQPREVAAPPVEPTQLAWLDEGALLLGSGRLGELRFLYCSPGRDWRDINLPPSAQTTSLGLLDPAFLDLGSDGVLVTAMDPPLVVAADGEAKPWVGKSSPLAVSPSGRLQLYQGPRSRNEGVVLLRIKDVDTDRDLPLVRFRGESHRDFAFSPDESRLGFILRGLDNEWRVMQVRIGDRYAMPVSLPGQDSKTFAWLTPRLLTAHRGDA
jgi:hypothetical protein